MTSTNMDRTTSKRATPLKNVGFLGRYYNILKLNPLDLDGSSLAKDRELNNLHKPVGWASRPSLIDGRDAHPTRKSKLQVI
jgi:hypothetical protein